MGTQNLAVLRYLGRKFDLYPCGADVARSDLFEQYVVDFREALTKACYCSADQFEEKKAEFVEKLPHRIEEVAKFIGAGPYALGEKITYVDFLALEWLDNIAAFSPEHFKSGPVAD